MKSMIEEVGVPAMLEQLAEECCELGQAALKMSRRMRGENPTPKTKMECVDSLIEEIADVELCINELWNMVDKTKVEFVKEQKRVRWQLRSKGKETEG